MTSSEYAQAYFDRQYNARASVQDPLAYMSRYTQESLSALSLPGAVRNQRYSPRATDVLEFICQTGLNHRLEKSRVLLFLSSFTAVTGAH